MKKGSLWYIIAAIVILGGIFAFKQYGTSSDGKVKIAAIVAEPKEDTQVGVKSIEVVSTTPPRTFDYTPLKPVDGKIKGVVEMGASGFNSFLIKIDKDKNWEILKKDFGSSFSYEGMATTEDIRSGLRNYIANMFDNGVSKNGVHFVISSGAQKEPKTLKIADELRKMGYVINMVTADQEGKFALRSVQPPSFKDNSFVVDIGSGNTKISWYDGSILKTYESYGAKYYENGTTSQTVYEDIRHKVAMVPEARRKVCFIIGGVPYKLAKKSRQGEERYTVLNNPTDYSADDVKISSGLNIYKALMDETKCDTFVFDWDANFTIGFLMQMPY